MSPVSRTENYVPTKQNYSRDGEKEVPLQSFDAKDSIWVEAAGGVLEKRHIAWGLPDELNRRPDQWMWADYSDESGPHWSRFTGHRILVDVQIRQRNNREVNDWKGRDEIYGTTVAHVEFNAVPVWERASRQIGPLLTNLQRDIDQLLQLDPLRWHVTRSPSDRQEHFGLIGRKVYYEGHPCRIVRFIGDQGCVILDPDPGPWPERPWLSLDEDEFEREESRKVEILSPHIWWYRDE